MAYVRTVKIASGAVAVQIVHGSRRGARSIEHVGSAHDELELEALKAAVRQRLAGGQTELDLGLDATLARAAAGGVAVDVLHRARRVAVLFFPNWLCEDLDLGHPGLRPEPGVPTPMQQADGEEYRRAGGFDAHSGRWSIPACEPDIRGLPASVYGLRSSTVTIGLAAYELGSALMGRSRMLLERHRHEKGKNPNIAGSPPAADVGLIDGR